jgi:hypothetical protein
MRKFGGQRRHRTSLKVYWRREEERKKRECERERGEERRGEERRGEERRERERKANEPMPWVASMSKNNLTTSTTNPP